MKNSCSGNLDSRDEIQIDDDIINKICANSEKAGTAKNVAFWSPEQYDILNENNRRVVLKSANSTGKTILMLYMMKKLLAKGEVVAFLIYQHHKKTERKSLLQLKIEEEFSEYVKSGQLVISYITGNYKKITFEVDIFSLRHVFIDELLILYDPQGEKRLHYNLPLPPHPTTTEYHPIFF